MSGSTDGGDIGSTRQTLDDEEQFERAIQGIRAVIAAYSARIGSADDAGDQELENQLIADCLPYQELRQRLRVTDRAEVARINTEFPALVARIRSDGS